MWKFALPRVVGGPHQQPHGPPPSSRFYAFRGSTGSIQTLSQASSALFSSSLSSSSSGSRIIRSRHASFLFAMATVAMVHQPHLITLAEAATVAKPMEPEEPEHDTFPQECPVHGCSLLPQDIFYDTKVREALERIRPYSRLEIQTSDDPQIRQALEVLESSGNHETATLTLIGYKGGAVDKQINQDRALVVSPFRYDSLSNSSKEASDSHHDVPGSPGANETRSTTARIVCVFDGHAQYGEKVSQYAVTQLPKMLASRFSNEDASLSPPDVQQALIETFVELDKTAPAEVSGGCTASVVLQLGRKVYVANAGDSRSFLVVYHKHTKQASVAYISREDKPNLADERARVEKMGGQVYEPRLPGYTSRVLYVDPLTGGQSGLAMSRSIGDWEVGKFGVIPDPIVGVIDIPELVRARVDQTRNSGSADKEDDVHIFAVSATDGMMDYVEAETIAEILSESLFEESGSHPLTACERLVSMAATGWQSAKQGRYRDDIAIAVSKIRTPPHVS